MKISKSHSSTLLQILYKLVKYAFYNIFKILFLADKIVTNLVKLDLDDGESNSEDLEIIKVKQNISIKEGKILRKYPETSVFCKCPNCKFDVSLLSF